MLLRGASRVASRAGAVLDGDRRCGGRPRRRSPAGKRSRLDDRARRAPDFRLCGQAGGARRPRASSSSSRRAATTTAGTATSTCRRATVARAPPSSPSTRSSRSGREAADLGAVWCLLTGGEPLLREDFADVFLGLKRLGLLVSVFTNACLVTPEHVELFRQYPPRDVEVSVYGATAATYEAVTRRPGSYDAFVRGLELLLAGGVHVRLKAMALRSNGHELDEIARFCRAHTRDYYRFDPLLHLRFDGDPARNDEIRGERLTPAEIVAFERADRSASGPAARLPRRRSPARRGGGGGLRPPLPLRRRRRRLHRGLRRHLQAVQLAVASRHRLRPAQGQPARGMGGLGAARPRAARRKR